jgi:trimethylamine:corrinoid methyltransferase-like protein
MFQTTLLTDSDVERMAEGVLQVLEEVGVFCQNDELLRALEAAGAQVDYESQRVCFAREMTSAYVEGFRANGDTDAGSGHRHFSAPGLPSLGTQVAQFYLDPETGERRSGNTKDFITLVKLGNVLHGDMGVGHCLLLTDVPPLLEPLEAALVLAEYAHKPAPPFAWHVRQAEYLAEMGEILGIKKWYSWGALCFSHPLRFDREVADRFVRRVREGETVGFTAMPVAGVTTPITVEGFTVVSGAEHVATWIAARALDPNIGLTGSQWGGTLDMKTGHVSYAAFDAMFYTFVSVEFLRRWCGIRVGASGGEYCDARSPGLYAALEKAYKAMMIAAFTGQHPSPGQGMLEEGKTLSPVQLLIERDLAAGIGHLARPVNPTAENIAMETIMEIGSGFTSNYLQSDHTLSNYRACCWIPELIDRSGWRGPEHEAQMLEATRAKIRAALSQYEKPVGREDQLEAMRAVVDRARRELAASS